MTSKQKTAGMTCEQLETFVIDFLEESLSVEENQKFKEHLNMCPPCKVYIDNYIQTIKLTGSKLKSESEPSCEDIPEALVQAILSSRPK